MHEKAEARGLFTLSQNFMTSMKPGHDQYIKLNDQPFTFHDHPLVTKPHWSYMFPFKIFYHRLALQQWRN